MKDTTTKQKDLEFDSYSHFHKKGTYILYRFAFKMGALF